MGKTERFVFGAIFSLFLLFSLARPLLSAQNSAPLFNPGYSHSETYSAETYSKAHAETYSKQGYANRNEKLQSDNLSLPEKLVTLLKIYLQKLGEKIRGEKKEKEVGPETSFGDLLTFSNKASPTPMNAEADKKRASSAARIRQIKKLLANLDIDSKNDEINKKLLKTPPWDEKPSDLPNLDLEDLQPNAKKEAIPNPSDLLIPSGTYPPKNNIGEVTDNPIKTTYVIALLGDSMIDALGQNLISLRENLKKAYPNYFFALLNYGQGSTDMESGLERLTKTTKYQGKVYPPLLSFRPDILIVESFAYNHWSGQLYDLDRQWITISKIIEKVQEVSPGTKIVLATTIGPDANTFGDGVLNWGKQKKEDSVLVTRAYLQNMINFANSQGYPLADAFTPSLDETGNGKAVYIDQSDHIHPSKEGAKLFFEKVTEAIKKNDIIQ